MWKSSMMQSQYLSNNYVISKQISCVCDWASHDSFWKSDLVAFTSLPNDCSVTFLYTIHLKNEPSAMKLTNKIIENDEKEEKNYEQNWVKY